MRIVLGLWILQAVTAGLAWLAFSNASSGQLTLWVGLVMGVGLLGALWFWSALRDQRRLGEAQRSERMANGVAELHAKVARQRAEDAAKLRKLTEKAADTRPRFLKIGFLAGVALGLCLALMLTQLLTLGLVAVTFAGGGLAGYAMRGRLHRRVLGDSNPAMSFDAASPTPVKLPSPRSKGKGLTLRLLRA